MKLLQWNIWFEEDIEKVAQFIQKLKPDIVCAQEVSKNFQWNGKVNTGKFLGKALGYHSYMQFGQLCKQDGVVRSLGCAIYSRYPIIKKRSVVIQKPHALSHRFGENYSHEGRVYVEIETKVEGRKIVVGTTHLAYERSMKMTARKTKEWGKIMRIVENKKSNYIFTGDLNAHPDLVQIKKLQKYLQHAGPSMLQKTTRPEAKGGNAKWAFPERLDYVFATPDLSVKSAKILKIKVSDHLPILVEFKL